MAGEPVYESIGAGYATQRRTDPRWAAVIHDALGDGRSVVNVGAGTGSYEPGDRRVVAVEPSPTMLGQRPAGSAPAIRATAEALPLPDASFDVAMAIHTTHHWTDAAAGFAELRRVARRQVITTWDPEVTARYWLVADYLPEIAEREAELPTLRAALAHLDVIEVRELRVPADITDGTLGAHWARPEAYLDGAVRASMSGLALLDPTVVDAAMGRLAADLADGTWRARHGDLLTLPDTDLGYRVVVAGT